MPYITPNTIPTAAICRRLVIPDDILIIAAVNGAITELIKPYNWEKVGAVTPDEIAAVMLQMWAQFQESDIICMIGAIVAWTNRVIPDNCLLCDGTTYNRIDYPDLYVALDSVFIIDADTFFVPDLSDRVIRSPSDVDDIGSDNGADSVTLTEGQLPSHSHSVGGAITALALAPGELPVLSPSLFPGVTGDTGSGDSIDIRPRYRAIPYVVIAR